VEALRVRLEPVVGAACREHSGEGAECESEALDQSHGRPPYLDVGARMQGDAKTDLGNP
jgi:hypothetical protein